ncbi:MFS transporter [Paenibacillus kyungheensis]|uniref:MFS transporter n=1 Tax=Paenibacillus kyungheensis TaxID=1452732 RepID=A0AAX3M7V4_9BACL|nr:MFS transporter [Paenibacillus kyungheensis]WCT57433.1 MFS transporter [Paenibacillus kyungheensis]
MRKFAFASYLMYFLAGLVVTTIGAIMPQLLGHYNLSYTEGGTLVFIGSIGFLIGVPLSAYMMHRFGEKVTLAISALVIAVTQGMMLTLPQYSWITVLNFFNSLSVSAIEVVVAALVMERFVSRRAVTMSYLEVSFGLGALGMPVFASGFIALGHWQWVFAVTGLISLVMGIVWMRIQYSGEEESSAHQAIDAVEVAPSATVTGRHKIVLLSIFLLMIFVYCGIEGSLNNFLSSIFITYFGSSEYYASISIGAFWGAMVVGRLATGWIIRRVNYSRFLLISMSLSLLVLLAFLVFRQEWAGYLLVPLLGFTMSGVYSITMVYANHTLPGMARTVTSLITGFAGFGNAVFPVLIGYTMDRAPIQVSLMLIASYAVAFLILLLIIMGNYRKWKRTDAHEAVKA